MKSAAARAVQSRQQQLECLLSSFQMDNKAVKLEVA